MLNIHQLAYDWSSLFLYVDVRAVLLRLQTLNILSLIFIKSTSSCELVQNHTFILFRKKKKILTIKLYYLFIRATNRTGKYFMFPCRIRVTNLGRGERKKKKEKIIRVELTNHALMRNPSEISPETVLKKSLTNFTFRSQASRTACNNDTWCFGDKTRTNSPPKEQDA